MKSLILTLSLLAIVALGAGTTFAAFRDTQPSTGNTFQAGQLDILIDGRDNQGNIFRTAYFTANNMKPGDTNIAYIEIANPEPVSGSVSNAPCIYRVYFDNVIQNPQTFAGQLQATVTLNPFPYSPDYRGNRYGGSFNQVIYSGPLSSLIGTGSPINNISRAFNNADPLRPGDLAIFKVEVTLPLNSGNAWQGATFTGRITVNSTQFEGQSQSNIIW